MNRIATIALLLSMALAPAPAFAQQPGRAPRPAQRQQMEERIRQRFGEQIRTELGLTDEQLTAVQEVQDTYQARRRALIGREAAVRRRLSQLREDLPDDQARPLLQELAAVRADEASLFQSEMDALLRTLTPGQVLRLYRLRDQLMDRVRRVRQGPMRPMRGPAGAPPPGRALTSPLDLG
jgi:hypothetical protein